MLQTSITFLARVQDDPIWESILLRMHTTVFLRKKLLERDIDVAPTDKLPNLAKVGSK